MMAILAAINVSHSTDMDHVLRQGQHAAEGSAPREKELDLVNVRVKLGSSLDTFRRRSTVNLYWTSCFQTNDDEPRSSRTGLDLVRIDRFRASGNGQAMTL